MNYPIDTLFLSSGIAPLAVSDPNWANVLWFVYGILVGSVVAVAWLRRNS